MKWEQTDHTQWVKKITEDVFHVVDMQRYGEEYHLRDVIVDISNMTKEELKEKVEVYYESLAQMKSVEGKAWKELAAELIAEQTEQVILQVEKENIHHVYTHLKQKYGIVQGWE